MENRDLLFASQQETMGNASQKLDPNSALHIEQAHINNMPKVEQFYIKSPKPQIDKGIFGYTACKHIFF